MTANIAEYASSKHVVLYRLVVDKRSIEERKWVLEDADLKQSPLIADICSAQVSLIDKVFLVLSFSLV